jgi:hypothetical protein
MNIAQLGHILNSSGLCHQNADFAGLEFLKNVDISLHELTRPSVPYVLHTVTLNKLLLAVFTLV